MPVKHNTTAVHFEVDFIVLSYVAYKNLLFEIGKQINQHDHQQLLDMCRVDDEADNKPDAIYCD